MHEFQAAIISKHQNTDALCRQTMDIFIRCYGAEAGLAGLKWLPYGGLYLAGGLTPTTHDKIPATPPHPPCTHTPIRII